MGGMTCLLLEAIGVWDCEVDSLTYSAIVNIPLTSRQGSF